MKSPTANWDYRCPLWCTGVHEVSDDLDVAHRSEVTSVPAIERIVGGKGDGEAALTVDLALGLEWKRGETWVWISPEDDVTRGLVLSVESANRLCRALSTLLATSVQSP